MAGGPQQQRTPSPERDSTTLMQAPERPNVDTEGGNRNTERAYSYGSPGPYVPCGSPGFRASFGSSGHSVQSLTPGPSPEPAEFSSQLKAVADYDPLLPVAHVAHIMKGALPEHAKFTKDAKECMQECVSEFLSFITSEVSEKATNDRRRILDRDDVISAMTSLDF